MPNGEMQTGRTPENYRILLRAPKAVVDGLQGHPSLKASLILAMKARTPTDLVAIPGGLAMSRECASRISNWHLWQFKDGSICVTKSGAITPPTGSELQDLRENLPTAVDLGEVNKLDYAVCVCRQIGEDTDRLCLDSPKTIQIA